MLNSSHHFHVSKIEHYLKRIAIEKDTFEVNHSKESLLKRTKLKNGFPIITEIFNEFHQELNDFTKKYGGIRARDHSG